MVSGILSGSKSPAVSVSILGVIVLLAVALSVGYTRLDEKKADKEATREKFAVVQHTIDAGLGTIKESIAEQQKDIRELRRYLLPPARDGR